MPVVIVNIAYSPPVPKAMIVATAWSFNPNKSPTPAESTVKKIAGRGVRPQQPG
jgi:hypothetical protein